MDMMYAFVKKADSEEMEPMVVEMNISMKSTTHRFYPCTQSILHRTAISYKGGLHDVTEGISYPSIEDWDASCVDWNRCEHDCIPEVYMNDRNTLDKQHLEIPKYRKKLLRTRPKRKDDVDDIISRLGGMRVHDRIKKTANVKRLTQITTRQSTKLSKESFTSINSKLEELSIYE